MRVIECRLGSAMIGFKLNCLNWEKPKTLLKLQKDLKKSLNEMIQLCKSSISNEIYTLEEISKEFKMSKENLIQNYFKSSSSNDLILIDSNEFKLLNRCLHVFSEAKRVEDFILNSKENKIEILGKLMNESHFSLRDKYEASCIELEKLTKICRNSNALGSRLTGAGKIIISKIYFF